MGDFNHPDICWKGNTAGHKQSKFLECTDGNFLTQVIEEPKRGHSLTDLILQTSRSWYGDMKIGGSLDCSDH